MALTRDCCFAHWFVSNAGLPVYQAAVDCMHHHIGQMERKGIQASCVVVLLSAMPIDPCASSAMKDVALSAFRQNRWHLEQQTNV